MSDTPDFTPDLPVDARCRIAPEVVHPTQFGLGMEEVRYRIARLETMGKAERHDYLVEHDAPIVIGPGGVAYLVDRHHTARAVMAAAPDHRLHATVIARWPDVSLATFWRRMETHGWVWRFDTNGEGPRDPVGIPASLKTLGDDYYRSIAWALRRDGAVAKVATPYAEFHWGLWLRTVYPDPSRVFEEDVAACVAIARQGRAKHLPGWIGERD